MFLKIQFITLGLMMSVANAVAQDNCYKLSLSTGEGDTAEKASKIVLLDPSVSGASSFTVSTSKHSCTLSYFGIKNPGKEPGAALFFGNSAATGSISQKSPILMLMTNDGDTCSVYHQANVTCE